MTGRVKVRAHARYVPLTKNPCAYDPYAMNILLSEVTAVRVLCKAPNCGASTEVPVDGLSQALRDGRCPGCGRSAVDLTAGHPLALLARALLAVGTPQTCGDIELVLNEPPTTVAGMTSESPVVLGE